MQTYNLVYDAADFHPGPWAFLALGPFLMLLGLLLIRFSSASNVKRLSNWPPNPAFAWIFFLFATVWTLVAGTIIIGAQFAVHNALADKTYHVVSGPVTDFKPRPKEEHTGWGFTVQGVRFETPDFQAYDGPVHADSHVRVSYICRPSERDCTPLIVRMETER